MSAATEVRERLIARGVTLGAFSTPHARQWAETAPIDELLAHVEAIGRARPIGAARAFVAAHDRVRDADLETPQMRVARSGRRSP